MHRKGLMLMLIVVSLLTISGCFGGNDSPPSKVAVEDLLDEEESFFAIYTTPPDWPRAIPAIMKEYNE